MKWKGTDRMGVEVHDQALSNFKCRLNNPTLMVNERFRNRAFIPSLFRMFVNPLLIVAAVLVHWML